ncbi:MAG: N-acetyltransferase [Pseudomonadota bacterium]
MTIIRPEKDEDVAVIRDLTAAAFQGKDFSDGTEADCFDRLRKDGDLALSLVAVDSGRIVGHVAFSPLHVADRSKGWFGLGPIAVTPDRQRQGIGTQLINAGLAALERDGAIGFGLIGDPAYYSRFGFIGDCGWTYRKLPPTYVQARRVGRRAVPRGEIQFSRGLE